MKQIEVMFDRFIDGKPPLKVKWQIRLVHIARTTSYDDSEITMKCILINHYHHSMYLWDIDNDKVIYSFKPETRADERGLVSIRKYLSDPENKKRIIAAARRDDAAFKLKYDLDYIHLQKNNL